MNKIKHEPLYLQNMIEEYAAIKYKRVDVRGLRAVVLGLLVRFIAGQLHP